MKIINNELIRSFRPCYDPIEKGIPDNETLSVKEWMEKYRGIVPDKDILWLLLRNEFYDDKQLRLFAVWCAREALKLIKNPDQRSIDACDVAERYANGNATIEELIAARNAAYTAAYAARNAAYTAAYAAYTNVIICDATYTAVYAARTNATIAANDAADAYDVSVVAANITAREKQLNYLLNEI